MNLFFETPPQELLYSIKTTKNGNVDYTEIDPEDMKYILAVFEIFLYHIDTHQFDNRVQKTFYHEVFVMDRPTLPKPSKENRKFNTYATFMKGLIKNNENGSRDFSTNVFDHVVETVNMCVAYFENYHPTFMPNSTIYKVVPVLTNGTHFKLPKKVV
jgi:hypothetical protein